MATWQQLAWKSETLTPAEIEALIAEVTAELIYTATGGSVPVGTVTSGTYASTNVHDGTPWDIQEAAGTPGFDIRLTFSDVETFNRVRGIVRYEGTVSHTVEIQVYDYVEDEWEVYDTVVSSDGYTSFEIIIPDPADHVDGSGNATIRLYHTTSGNPSHNMHLDYVCLARAGIGAVSDHGLLGGLDDDDHIQYYNETRGDARYGQLGAANEWAGTQTYDDGGANFVTIDSDGLTLADAGINFATAAGTPYINYNDYLLLSRNASPVLTLDDSGFVLVENRLGIGTTSPGEKLEVYGNSPAIKIQEDSSSNYYLKMQVNYDGPNAVKFIGPYGAVFLNYSTSAYTPTTLGTGSPNWVILDAARVGIGTTSPGHKLVLDTSISDDGLSLRNGAVELARLFNDGTSNVGRLLLGNAGSWTTNITAYGNSYFTGGNVGIGTSSPGYTLDVNGSLRVTGTTVLDFAAGNIRFSDSYYGPDLYVNDAGGWARTISWRNDYPGATKRFGVGVLGGGSGATRGYLAFTDGDDNFYTSAAGISILSDGRTGIGTTSPARMLDVSKAVSGTSHVPHLRLNDTGTVADTKGGVEFYNSTYSWVQGRVATERQGSSNAHDLVLYSGYAGSAVEGLRIRYTGNVGIGTTSPQGKLHAHDGAGGFMFVTKSGITSYSITILPSSGGVSYAVYLLGVALTNASIKVAVNAFIAKGTSADIVDGSGNTLRITCNSDGSLTATTVSGGAIWYLSVIAVWK